MDDSIILQLVDKFGSNALSELDFSSGDQRLVLRKERAEKEKPENAQAAGSREAGKDLPSRYEKKEEGEKITSPIVATFYPSADPGKPPYVTAGSRVKAGDTLCILEAMKMMNHLEAEFDSEILGVEAKSGELVEYGQTLFRVRRL